MSKAVVRDTIKAPEYDASPDTPFSVEWVRSSELEVDPQAQRDHLDYNKVGRIKKFWNPAAVGIITVSRRNPVTKVVIDGMHRQRAYLELTDGTGLLLCHVYDGLTPAEESQMFIDLNAGNKPDALDTFRHELRAGHQLSVEVDQLVKAFQWQISREPGDGSIKAVMALKRVYQRSVEKEQEPNALLMTMKVITGAWGHDKDAVVAVMLEGISSFVAEHSDRLDFDSLETKLRGYPGGPYALHQNATSWAGTKRIKVSMAVAELLTDLYNERRGQKTQLPPWRKRSA